MRVRFALLIVILFVLACILIASCISAGQPTHHRHHHHYPHHHRHKPVPLPTTTTTTVPPAPPVVAPTTTTTTAPAQPAWDTVTPWQREAWTRVAICEEGGFVGYAGDAYPDSLGISAVNWSSNGGWNPPAGVDPETPDWQIMVAERIQTDPPDQGSCHAW